MLFLTLQDIEQRKARGLKERYLYKPSTERVNRAAEIVGQVTEAFEGVKLGMGVGLFEGQAIDNYDGDEERAKLREKDEKEDWRRIESMDLIDCHSSLSFFDALGMRFHLPAFICSELKGEFGEGLDITLSGLNDWNRPKFGLLSSQQQSAVSTFLEFLAQDADSEFSRESIERDLVEYWTVS